MKQNIAALPHQDDDQTHPGFAGIVHGSTVVIGGSAVIITGESGTGKSDLALRLIDRGAKLLGDDGTHVEQRGGAVVASAPANIAGLIEVRGVGIVAMPYETEAPVAMAVALLEHADGQPPRYPLETETVRLCGLDIPLIRLHGLEESAPIKVELALSHFLAGGGSPDMPRHD